MACLRGADEGWTEECRSVWHHESQWREGLHTRGLSGSGASRSSSVARGPLTRRSTFSRWCLDLARAALRSLLHARRGGGGRRGDDIQCGCGPGFPSLVSHPPLHPLPCPLPTAHSPHCTTRTSHTPTESHTHHTHTDSSVSVITPNFSTYAALPPPPKPAALTTTHCSPRPCPGNSALHHHQPGP